MIAKSKLGKLSHKMAIIASMTRNPHKPYSRIIRKLALATLALAPWCAKADSDRDLRKELTIKVINAWQKEDFGALEIMENEYVKGDARSPSGKRILAIFEQNLRWCISIRKIDITQVLISTDKTLNLAEGVTDPDESKTGPDPSRYPAVSQEWDEIEKKVDRWDKQYPTSANSKIAKAIYYKNRGSYFRGTQWAKDVHEEAWPIYRQNLEAAKQLLIDTQQISQRNPIWFSLMLNILGAQSPSREEIDAVVSDTLEKGHGYPPAIQSAFHFMQPRWGGSYESMEKFARIANRKSYKEERGGIYARLYWNLIAVQKDEANTTFFERTGASWSILSQSFESIIRDYPEPRNFSGYALFSCMANDVSKAKMLLAKAQSLEYTKNWPLEMRNRCAPK